MAKVGSRPITTDDIRQRIAIQGSFASRRYHKPEKVRELLEDRIRFELLVRTGVERALDRDPGVIEAARNVMVRKLLARDLDSALAEENVPEERIKRYYDRYQADYQQPEKRRFSHIQLAPTEEGRAFGNNLINKLKDGRSSFRSLASRHSLEAETRKRGGEMFFMSQNELLGHYGKSFAVRIFESEPGLLVSEPIQSIKGWHVIHIHARREALVRELSEVRGDIRERLLKTERTRLFDQYLADIRRRYPVAIYEQQLTRFYEELAQESEESR